MTVAGTEAGTVPSSLAPATTAATTTTLAATAVAATESSTVPPSLAPATTATSAAPDAMGVRDFVVLGATVRVVTELPELAEHATVIRSSGTVIDDGDGPRMCMLYVAESYPPQCGGPIVEGLQMGDWAETVDGVSFGERTVDVSWPPVDDHVTLLAERDYEPVGVPQPPASAPGEFSATELRTAADAIGAAMLRGDLDIGGFYQDDTSRRVVVEVVAADKATVRALADLVDDPSILVVIGFDEIVEGP
jgi:hypothetical protein